jgi:hypothetical protein
MTTKSVPRKTRISAADAAFLRKSADTIRSRRKRVIADIVCIGDVLSKCKQRLPHGRWLPWLKDEFGWSEQTARNFMNVAELAKTKTVVDLPIEPKALYRLAAPSTPEPVRDRFLASAQAGETIKYIQVQHAVREPKPMRLSITSDTPPSERPYTRPQYPRSLIELHEIERLKAAEQNLRNLQVVYSSWNDVCEDIHSAHGKVVARLKRLEKPEPEPEPTDNNIVPFSS